MATTMPLEFNYMAGEGEAAHGLTLSTDGKYDGDDDDDDDDCDDDDYDDDDGNDDDGDNG